MLEVGTRVRTLRDEKFILPNGSVTTVYAGTAGHVEPKPGQGWGSYIFVFLDAHGMRFFFMPDNLEAIIPDAPPTLEQQLAAMTERAERAERERDALKVALAPFVKAGKCLTAYEATARITIRDLTGTSWCAPLLALRPAEFVKAIEAVEGVFVPNKIYRG